LSLDHKHQKQQVQKQFGGSAASYATSAVHAKGKSLTRLIDLLDPKPTWRVLDVATAAGHTGHKFAPFVSSVVALDLTFEMLQVARSSSLNLGLKNVSWITADAAHFPAEDQSFDLVTCRIATHHFSDIGAFLRESRRVLVPGGKLAVVDNIVPGSHRRGRKGQKVRDAAVYINAFEKLRDPSHAACLSLESWQEYFFDAGFDLFEQAINEKELDLDDWSERMKVAISDRLRLEVMLKQAPAEVTAFLKPKFSGSRIKFYLTEALLVGEIKN
jgi:ubiquinone/menaquinone biosynthesis C-methylase UbiE